MHLNAPQGPLHGMTVLDLSTVIAGPYAAQILGDMGATVIKIESPGGDIMRGPGPSRSPGMGAAFLNCNRNKQSVTLDLKNGRDRDRLLDLAANAQVLLHNMRPGAIARLGLAFEDLAPCNPRLIYCAIVGYGQDGPYCDRPAYDDIIQAACGWAELEGRTQGEPRYASTIVADKISALYAVSAINAALLHRERTGEGQYVEVPMYETLASFLLVEHLAGKTFQPALGHTGYSRLLSRHRRPYRTLDGYISVMPYTGKQWKAFFELAGRGEWAADARLLSTQARAAMIDDLYGRLADILVQRATGEWMRLLAPEDIPCSPVNSLEELLDDDHMRAVGFFMRLKHPTEGDIVVTRPPIRFSKTPCGISRHAPSFDQKEII
ncbi:CoA transferase [Castellaniella sp.]|uniref:CaiB/BaiF CoA transferase family protein n=1 Tax=Castellaniella sp. TaxID=1955812 RepID=UPI002AFF4B0C|nr:CoA transferase [Castellaniella sp.]